MSVLVSGDCDDLPQMPGKSNQLKSEVGRTERAATRRNKIFTSKMHVDIREIDRNMKLKLRQIELERQRLFTELDSLESRSGWLRDVEKSSLAEQPTSLRRRRSSAGIVLPKQSTIEMAKRAATFVADSQLPRRQSEKEPNAVIVVTSHDEQPRQGQEVTAEVQQPDGTSVAAAMAAQLEDQPQPGHLVRSHTELQPDTQKDGRSTSSQGKPTSAGQVRFTRPATTILGDRLENTGSSLGQNRTLDTFEDTLSTTRDGDSSPFPMTRRSPANRMLSSDTLSDSSRRKSLLYISGNDARYRLLDIPVQEISSKKIKSHAMDSQRVRTRSRTGSKTDPKTSESGGGGGGGGTIDLGGEYIPKRVKLMREEKLNMRRVHQDVYNEALMETALAKFKELYVVPMTGGLAEAKEFLSTLKS